MKRLLVAISCALAIAASGVQAEEWKNIRIAFDVPYAPFEYRAPNGELTGFEVELARAVCEEMNANCEFVVQAWDGIIPGLLARKYDAIMSSMSITDERRQMVLFSEPYYNTPSSWFGPKGVEVDVSSKEGLKGLIIGVQRGTTQDAYVTEHYSDVAEINRYSTADDLLLDLEAERVDVAFLDFPVGEETLVSQGGYVKLGEDVKLGEGMAVAMRKRDKELAEKFNRALAEVKQNGTYDRIMKKYFDYDIKM